VVHVLDAALGEAQVTQVDLVKDHSLQHIVRTVETLNIATITCGLFNDYISTTEYSPQCPECLWSPHSLLSNGERGSFPAGKAAGA
jgi:hypothetical protein